MLRKFLKKMRFSNEQNWAEHSSQVVDALLAGQIDEGIFHARLSYELARKDTSISKQDMGIVASNLAIALSHTENHVETLGAFEQAQKIYETHAEYSDDYLDLLRGYLQFLIRSEQWEIAQNIAEQSMQIADQFASAQQKENQWVFYKQALRIYAKVQNTHRTDQLCTDLLNSLRQIDDRAAQVEKTIDLCFVFEDLGFRDLARHQFEEMLAELDPQDPEQAKLYARTIFALANLEYECEEFEQAETHYLRALALYQRGQLLMDREAFSVLNNFALLLTRLEKWDQAKSILLKTLDSIRGVEQSSPETQKMVLINLSHIAFFQKEYELGIQYLERAQEFCTGIGQEMLLQKADLCDRLSQFYEQIEDWTSVVRVGREGMAYLRKLSSNAMLGEVTFLSRAANACLELELNEGALEFYQMALQQVLAQKQSDPSYLQIAYGNVAVAYERLDQWADALANYEQSIAHIPEEHSEDRALYQIHRARALFHLGQAPEALALVEQIQHALDQLEEFPLWIQIDLRLLGVEILDRLEADAKDLSEILDRNVQEILDVVQGEDVFEFLLQQLEIAHRVKLQTWCLNLIEHMQEHFPRLCMDSALFERIHKDLQNP